MILRRFMDHIRQMNWFAVGIDFLVVVIGLFIGMQVTNWNEARKDRLQEKQYLIRLKADLQDSLMRNQGSINQLIVRDDKMQIVIDSLERGSIREEEKADFEQGLLLSLHTMPIYMNRATFDEIISRGHMGLIENAILRNRLLQLHARIEDQSKYILRSERRIYAFSDVLDTSFYVGYVFDKDKKIQMVNQWDMDVLNSNPKFRQIFITLKGLSYYNRMWLEQVNERITKFLAILETELQRQHIPTVEMDKDKGP